MEKNVSCRFVFVFGGRSVSSCIKKVELRVQASAFPPTCHNLMVNSMRERERERERGIDGVREHVLEIVRVCECVWERVCVHMCVDEREFVHVYLCERERKCVYV